MLIICCLIAGKWRKLSSVFKREKQRDFSSGIRENEDELGSWLILRIKHDERHKFSSKTSRKMAGNRRVWDGSKSGLTGFGSTRLEVRDEVPDPLQVERRRSTNAESTIWLETTSFHLRITGPVLFSACFRFGPLQKQKKKKKKTFSETHRFT